MYKIDRGLIGTTIARMLLVIHEENAALIEKLEDMLSKKGGNIYERDGTGQNPTLINTPAES